MTNSSHSIIRKKNDSKGQLSVAGMLGVIVLIFVVFTVGRILFNATVLDPDTADGGINTQGGTANPRQDSLMNIGLLTMMGIILISGMARIVIGFFS